METHINTLFELCKQQPFDIKEIENYIRDNKLSNEEVTRAAIKLCDYGMLFRFDYLLQNEKEPLPEEFPTQNWEMLFDIFIENGLDPDLVICDDGTTISVAPESLAMSIPMLDKVPLPLPPSSETVSSLPPR